MSVSVNVHIITQNVEDNLYIKLGPLCYPPLSTPRSPGHLVGKYLVNLEHGTQVRENKLKVSDLKFTNWK